MATAWPGRASPPIVFLTRKLPDCAKRELAEAGALPRTWPHEAPPSPAELRAEALPAAALVTLLTDRLDADSLGSLPELRIVANFAVGVDNVDLEAANRLGILVTNTPDVLTNACAEYTISLILCAARRLVEAERFLRAGRFKGWSPLLLLGSEIAGKTLGIVGAGRIGQAVGRKAAALGMAVLYDAPTPRPEFERAAGARRVPLEELLAAADFVSLHCPLTRDTRRLMSAGRLALMKPTAWLLNIARGPVVDESALAEALRRGRIAGAALDVYEEEPKVFPPLLALENVLLLPHLASATVEARTRMAEVCVANVLAALRGEVPPNLVNPRALDARRG